MHAAGMQPVCCQSGTAQTAAWWKGSSAPATTPRCCSGPSAQGVLCAGCTTEHQASCLWLLVGTMRCSGVLLKQLRAGASGVVQIFSAVCSQGREGRLALWPLTAEGRLGRYTGAEPPALLHASSCTS